VDVAHATNIPGQKVSQGSYSAFVPAPLPTELEWTPRLEEPAHLKPADNKYLLALSNQERWKPGQGAIGKPWEQFPYRSAVCPIDLG